jgi:hypothetical protein
MKTLRLVGVAFLTVLLNFCLSGCGKSGDDNNSESKKWNCVFTLNGQDVKVGETIHVVDKLTKYTITWKDANGVADVTNAQIIEYDLNIINGDSEYMNSFDFYVKGLGKSKVILHDYITDQDYFFYIEVDPIDLKEHFEINGPHIDYLINDKVVDGPFISLKLSKEINDFRRMGYVDIISFGSDTGMKAANADNGYWPSVWDTEKGEQGRTYVGKIGNQTATYWAFKIDYRGQSHEIRRYGDSKVFLWDGEWNN